MGLRVNTNVTSINAQRNLATVTDRLAGNFRRLSTGLRISTADKRGVGKSAKSHAQGQRTGAQGKVATGNFH